MLLSNCTFVVWKNQLLSKIKKLIVFQITSLKWIKSLTNFLLTGYKFMPELHLKQPGFTYSACGPFTKHLQNFWQTNLKQL